MKILVLSFYHPPDLSAGSFRVSALTRALKDCGQNDLEIDIITSMPNRYSTHSIEASADETSQGVRIRRIVVPSHTSGMVDQARSFLVFAREVRAMTKSGHWDLVFATSSRLMTAVLGAYVARRARAPLYLDIRDLFTDTIADLLRTRLSRYLLPVLRYIERITFRQAKRINLVSIGFLSHSKKIAPNQEFRFFTNGIDREFLEADYSKHDSGENDLPVIFYCGNIGEGQGLHNIVPEAAQKLGGKARFRLFGDGGRRTLLEAELGRLNCQNVELRDPVPREALFEQYRQADILFLHLNDHTAFEKVLPSKIFEYAATGKPILAGVSGHAAAFLEEHVPGCEVFSPCNANAMAAAATSLLHGPQSWDREAFKKKFSREKIMTEMAHDILITPLS